MLQAIRSKTAAIPSSRELTVFFPHRPKATIASLARLAAAHRTFGPMPPTEDLFIITPRVETALLADFNTSLAALGTRIISSTDLRTASFDAIGSDALRQLAGWFAVAPLAMLRRDYLFEARQPTRPMGAPADKATVPAKAKTALTALTNLGGDGWLSPDEITHLCDVTLQASYGRMAAESSWLVKPEVAPDGVQKELWAMVARVRKLFVAGVVLRDSIELAPLRELAALILCPAFRPLLDYAAGDIRDRIETYATKILAMKMHPWIAETERWRLPAGRYTLWAADSLTMGLTAGTTDVVSYSSGKPETWKGPFDTVRTFASGMSGAANLKAGDVRDWFLADDQSGVGRTLLRKFVDAAAAVLLRRETMADGDIAAAEAFFGLTQPNTPPQVHLHGDTWRPLIQTGDAASEAITDLATLLARPRMPLRDPQGAVFVAGPVDALQYSAKQWVDQTGSANPTAHPFLLHATTGRAHGELLYGEVPLFVAPHRPEITEAYGLRALSPEMVKPVSPAFYFGDDDAIFDQNTIEGLTRLLGYADVPSLLANKEVAAGVAELFSPSSAGGGYVPVHTVDRLFHSSRTRQTWRSRVDIPRDAIPKQTVAVDKNSQPRVAEVQATIVRNEEIPMLSVDSLSAADALAISAVKLLGYPMS